MAVPVVVAVSVIATMIVVATTLFVAVEFMSVAIPMELTVLAVMGKFAMIAMMRVIAVIYMAVPAVRAMEPWTCSNEYAVGEPLWTVVAIGGAIVGGVVEITIRAHRRRSNMDADGYLGSRRGSGKEGKPGDNREDCKIFHKSHLFTSGS